MKISFITLLIFWNFPIHIGMDLYAIAVDFYIRQLICEVIGAFVVIVTYEFIQIIRKYVKKVY